MPEHGTLGTAGTVPSVKLAGSLHYLRHLASLLYLTQARLGPAPRDPVPRISPSTLARLRKLAERPARVTCGGTYDDIIGEDEALSRIIRDLLEEIA